MKQALLLLFAAALGSGVNAQVKEKVDDAARRPDRPAQSARADLYVQDQTKISADSTAAAVPSKAHRKNKKKRCTKKHGA
ncbi:MAG: hypothetical protein EOO15_16090 [Chitinophagaceae bacterium]|nr:MAG: hypothetical protein EOO15_16090 [Chitinophagaceae bacterium]